MRILKSKQFLTEFSLYIKQGKKRKFDYNTICKNCCNDCKQGCKVDIIACKKFSKI